MIRYPIVILVLFAGILMAGCVQQAPVTPVVPETPVTEIPTAEPTLTVEEEVVNQSQEPAKVSEPDIPVTPVQPSISETPLPTPTADPNLAFRELVLTKLDLIQEGKKKVLSAWEAEDPALVSSLVDDLRHLIRNNNDGSTFPKKMDYVRLNYYDFIDRMSQFADNFEQAASLMERGEKSSANSYVSAGIMSGDRADISDKRIRVFLIDHPVLL